MFTLPSFFMCLVVSLAPFEGDPPDAPPTAQETRALKTSFEILNSTEFGRSASIAKLLERDDVNGVAVAFIASFMDGIEREALELQKLYDEYRKRGVVIIVSVDPSSGSKGIKETVESKGITVPMSLTGKQWETFQKTAGDRVVNSWPWTFYVNKEGRFVEKSRSSPTASSLEAIARAVIVGIAPTKQEGGEPAPPGVPPGAPAEPERSECTASEITLVRPEAGGWRFEEDGSGAFARLVLVKPFAEGAVPKDGLPFEKAWGIEALELLGRHEASVLVTTLDRRVHTGIGSMMVDPGSKAQLVDAHLALLKKESKDVGRVKKSSNASLGGLSAAQLRARVTAADGREFDVTGYFVPVRQHTYCVWFLAAAGVAKETEKQLDEIKKKTRFERGGGS